MIEYINGRSNEQLEVETVSCDDKCDLGKWIYGDAKKFSHLKEYEALKAHHAAFHQSVGAIVEATQHGDIDQAKRMLGGDFYKASKQTIEAIRNMQTRVEGGGVTLKSATLDMA